MWNLLWNILCELIQKIYFKGGFVYDKQRKMAGNVYKWTMENYGTNFRTTRGDSFRLSEQGINYPLSMRDCTFQDTVDITVGFRISLFLN